MAYNPWYSNEKIHDEQEQCELCGRWDKFLYYVFLKQDKKKLCFQCYHKLHESSEFDEIS